jgi:hypothetical protein
MDKLNLCEDVNNNQEDIEKQGDSDDRVSLASSKSKVSSIGKSSKAISKKKNDTILSTSGSRSPDRKAIILIKD